MRSVKRELVSEERDPESNPPYELWDWLSSMTEKRSSF